MILTSQLQVVLPSLRMIGAVTSLSGEGLHCLYFQKGNDYHYCDEDSCLPYGVLSFHAEEEAGCKSRYILHARSPFFLISMYLLKH